VTTRPTTVVDQRSTPPARWWIYQRERFPVFAHGPLIAAFSSSAVAFSFLLRGGQGLPSTSSFVVAFCSSFLFFLQLRIADEFKDHEEDTLYRPYRPVPRGLVTLNELRVLGIGAAVVQAALALWLQPALLLLLAVVWLYLALMSCEFFARDWLKARPFTYMWTHMLIMPLIDGYATACEWLPTGSAPPHGLEPFLLVSFFNGIVLEIGRKTRAPQDEEDGVETYSSLWGPPKAAMSWLIALAMTALVAWWCAAQIRFEHVVSIVLGTLLLIALLVGIGFIRNPQKKNAQLIEATSAIWTLLMYLSLGTIPLLLRLRGAA
jgi:4-hydroxybenzoate polyprenyltransferase